MRRHEREIGLSEAKEILQLGEWGVLSLSDKNGTPYAVGLNYVFCEGKNCIYFHCAAEGRKIDIIKENKKCSFFVAIDTKTLSKKYTTQYKSVSIAGVLEIVLEEEEKAFALKLISVRFSPEMQNHAEVIQSTIKKVCILRLNIEEMTGKKNFKS